MQTGILFRFIFKLTLFNLWTLKLINKKHISHYYTLYKYIIIVYTYFLIILFNYIYNIYIYIVINILFICICYDT